MSEFFEKRTLRDALRVIFRRWHVFLVAASVFAVGLMWSAHYWPLCYTGTTFFERTMDPAVADLKNESFESLKRTLTHRLGGREAVEKVIKDCDLERGLPHGPDGQLTLEGNKAKQGLVAEFQKRLRTSFPVQSPTIDIVSVEFTHEDPELASKVPNLLVANYTEWVHKSIYDSLAASNDFLEEQASKCKRRLDELEQQRLEFEVKHAGMFPDSPDALQTRINALHSDLDTRRLQQQRAQRELSRLESLTGSADQSKPDVPTPEATRKPGQVELEYARAEAYLEYLRGELDTAKVIKNYTELHPDVKALRTNIREVEAKIEGLKTRLPSGYAPPPAKAVLAHPENLQMALAAVRSEAEVTTAEIERLENQLKQLESAMADFTVVRQQYLEFMGKIRDVQAEATRWKVRQDEVQMALKAEVAKKRTHLESVQMAEKQFRPSSPKLLMVLAMAYVGGLAFGGGVVFLLSFLDRSITTTEEASKYFNVPVHGVIGEIITAKRRLQRKLKRYVQGPIVTLIILAALGSATLSITLWLKVPEKFGEWKDAPVRFVYDQASTLAEDLWQRLRS